VLSGELQSISNRWLSESFAPGPRIYGDTVAGDFHDRAGIQGSF